MGLQGTLDTFSLAEILGLIERARHTGALVVESPDGHGTLYITAGRFCAGEAADYSGPVEDRHALDVRLIDVCFHLMRFDRGVVRVHRRRGAAVDRRAGHRHRPDRRDRRAHRAGLARGRGGAAELRRAPRAGRGAARGVPDPVSRTAFKVFTLIDGVRTVRQIAREAGHSVVEVGPVLKDLIEHGAVRIASGDRRSGPEPRRLGADPAAGRGPRRPRGRPRRPGSNRSRW